MGRAQTLSNNSRVKLLMKIMGKNNASEAQKISNLNLGGSDGGSLDIKGQDY
jgi:hypothetical protein